MNFTVDKTSAVPYYHQIKETVKAMLASSQLKAGDMLPPEVGLSEQLGISVLVVHRAFRELVLEGLLTRKRGLGTFVAIPHPMTYLVNAMFYGTTDELAKDGIELSTRILEQKVIPASNEVREKLKLPEQARVIHIERLDLVKQLPYGIEYLYFVYELFPALATIDLNNRSTFSLIKEMYHLTPQEAIDEITAGAATAKEASLLGLRSGQPVIRKHRIAFLADGTPFMFGYGALHADHYKFIIHEHLT